MSRVAKNPVTVPQGVTVTLADSAVTLKGAKGTLSVPLNGGVQVTQANDHGLPMAEQAAKNPLRKELQKLAKSLFDLNQSAEVKRA